MTFCKQFGLALIAVNPEVNLIGDTRVAEKCSDLVGKQQIDLYYVHAGVAMNQNVYANKCVRMNSLHVLSKYRQETIIMFFV